MLDHHRLPERSMELLETDETLEWLYYHLTNRKQIIMAVDANS